MIARGLREIENEIAADKFVWDQWLEDVHMNIEAALTKRIGAAGAKLHTGQPQRSNCARSSPAIGNEWNRWRMIRNCWRPIWPSIW